MNGLGSIVLAFVVSLMLAAAFGTGAVLVFPGVFSTDYPTQVGSVAGSAVLACAALWSLPGALLAGGLLFFEAQLAARVARTRFTWRRA